MYLVTSDGTPQGEKEKEERPPELPLLSEQLSLDELWDMLGECLKELEESHDQHAVLGELFSEGTDSQPLGLSALGDGNVLLFQSNCILCVIYNKKKLPSLLVTLVHFAFRLRFSLLLIAFPTFLTSSLTLSTIVFPASFHYLFFHDIWTRLWRGGGVCVLKFVECHFAVVAIL